MLPTTQHAHQVAQQLQDILDNDQFQVLVRPSYRHAFHQVIASIQTRLAKGQFPADDPTIFKPEVL